MSDADEIGVIQKRIVQNVYNSSIVVCDVSGKNPNVMFELGLRLAFDKPTVIIKDDKTDYSFDTGVIEHIPYPRDLRFAKIVEFKKRLAEKVANTHKASIEDPKHSPFLNSFGQFHVASLTQSEVSLDKVMIEMLADMNRDLQILKRRDREGAVGSGDRTTRSLLRQNIMQQIMELCGKKSIGPDELLVDRELLSKVGATASLDLQEVISISDVVAILQDLGCKVLVG